MSKNCSSKKLRRNPRNLRNACSAAFIGCNGPLAQPAGDCLDAMDRWRSLLVYQAASIFSAILFAITINAMAATASAAEPIKPMVYFPVVS